MERIQIYCGKCGLRERTHTCSDRDGIYGVISYEGEGSPKDEGLWKSIFYLLGETSIERQDERFFPNRDDAIIWLGEEISVEKFLKGLEEGRI